MPPFDLDPDHPREFAPILPFEFAPFREMFGSLGGLARAGRQKGWQTTLDGSKAVCLFFFSPWCETCHRAAPVLRDAAAAYEGRGFSVLGVSEYAEPAATEEYRKLHRHDFPFVYESMHRDAGEDEDLWHRRLRASLADPRKWGVPLFLFHVRGVGLFACAGEARPEELGAFLEKHLP